MLNTDDLKLLEALDSDFAAFERQAAPDVREAFTRRRDLLRDARHLAQNDGDPAHLRRIADLILTDLGHLIDAASAHRQATLLFRRRQFALEMLIRRIPTQPR